MVVIIRAFVQFELVMHSRMTMRVSHVLERRETRHVIEAVASVLAL